MVGGEVFEINDSGMTAGDSVRVESGGRWLAQEATIWSADGVPTLLGIQPDTDTSTVLGLAADGSVAGGSMRRSPDGVEHFHAFVWRGSGPILTLPVPGLSYAESWALAHPISTDGTVGGSSGPLNGIHRPTIWTCAFEQATVEAGTSVLTTQVSSSLPTSSGLSQKAMPLTQ
jgi:uncharacterized membrane protein